MQDPAKPGLHALRRLDRRAAAAACAIGAAGVSWYAGDLMGAASPLAVAVGAGFVVGAAIVAATILRNAKLRAVLAENRRLARNLRATNERLEGATAVIEKQRVALRAEVAENFVLHRRFDTLFASALGAIDTAVAVFSPQADLLEFNDSFARLMPDLAARVRAEGQVSFADVVGSLDAKGWRGASADMFEYREAPRLLRGVDDGVLKLSVAQIDGGARVLSLVDMTDLERARSGERRSVAVLEEGLGVLRAGFMIWDAQERLVQKREIDGLSGPGAHPEMVPGVSFRRYLQVLREVGYAERRENSTTRNGNSWSDDFPLADRIGEWRRALPNGRRLLTKVVERAGGGYMVVTLDVTEAAQGELQSEIRHKVLSAAFEALPAAYQYWSLDGRLVLHESTLRAGVSPGVSHVLRAGMPFAAYDVLVSTEEAPDVRDRSTIRNGKTWTDRNPLENRVGVWDREKADGTALRTTMVRTAEGGYLAVTLDMTDIRTTQRRAENSERMLTDIVRSIGAYWAVWTPDCRLDLWGDNASISPVWARRQKALTRGMSYSDFLRVMREGGSIEDPIRTQRVAGLAYDEFEDLPKKIGTWRRVTRDGRFLRTIVARLTDGGYSIVTIDVSDQERDRAVARQARETLNEVVGTIAVNYSLWDKEQRLVLHSKSEGGLDVAAGTPFAQVRAQFADGTDRADSTRRDGVGFDQVTDLAAAVGTWDRYLEDGRFKRVNVSQLSDGSFAIVDQDLTELESARSAAARNERLASLGGMVAGIAHEVNTPLGVAMTAVTLINSTSGRLVTDFRNGTLSETAFAHGLGKIADSATFAERNLDRAHSLMENFKQVAADQTSEVRREVDVRAYIRDIVETLTPVWRRTRHRFTVVQGDPVVADIYPGALAQIVTNLSDNALNHAFDGRKAPGQATLDVSATETEVVLKYADNGIGLTDDARRRLFEPFFTTRRARGGTGLGMTIVHNLVARRLGGSIELLPAREGLSLVIRFPRISPKTDGE